MPVNQSCRLTIAHINDTHSYFEPSLIQFSIVLKEGSKVINYQPYVSVGGFARIKTRVDQLRHDALDSGRKFLFLHGGDCFQGTLYFSLFKGLADASMLNRLGINAMVVGNHELDLGNEVLANFAANIEFDLLAGNWDLSGEDSSKSIRLDDNDRVVSYNPEQGCAYFNLYYCGEEPIALFGVTQDQMSEIANPDSDTPFVNAISVVENTVELIRAKGINKIILLSHLGYEEDKWLANRVKGISLIIGGHSHVLQGDFSRLGLDKNDRYGQRIGDCYVVQSGLYSHALGHCEIDFAADGSVTRFAGQNELLLGRRLFLKHQGNVTDISANNALKHFIHNHPDIRVVAKDPELHQYLHSTYTQEVRRLEADKIASLPNSLRHVRIPDQQGGSEIAPLVARSFRYALRQRGYHTDFAIHNAGGVRCSLDSGDITSADISGKLLPFAIPVGRYKISGRGIRNMLEGAINNALNNGVVGTGTGSYPYCDGLRFHYYANKAPGNRISGLMIYQDHTWVPLIMSKTYYGTSTIYTMKGKEGYAAILHLDEPALITDITMAEAFILWLKHSRFHYDFDDETDVIP